MENPEDIAEYRAMVKADPDYCKLIKPPKIEIKKEIENITDLLVDKEGPVDDEIVPRPYKLDPVGYKELIFRDRFTNKIVVRLHILRSDVRDHLEPHVKSILAEMFNVI